jgi:hypothetical protein
MISSAPPPLTEASLPCRNRARSAADAVSTVSASSKLSPTNGPCPSPSPNALGVVGLDASHRSTPERRRRCQAPPLKLLLPPRCRPDRTVSPRRQDLAQHHLAASPMLSEKTAPRTRRRRARDRRAAATAR